MNDKQKYIEKDKILEDLFADFTPDKPTGDFTKNTMNKVFQEWSKQPVTHKSILNTKNKIWISVSVICAAILVYLIDFKNATQQSTTIAESLNISESLKAFNKTFEVIGSSFSHIPSLVYIIFIGIGMILILDKMISKTIKTT
ncbi:hypothetical protein [Plebeiibacterium sediminum]|uniref:Uncharacterized protein n=1 Tax=Plebeiibacterium sediminum TaxID=2992112 RepID=A0AAE3M915_9BACT|nr:hypothetical protein [Plebeiobacterium sediminum]MCW3789464.1 hypothetical protein [Plebeiobacterium sediminum]